MNIHKIIKFNFSLIILLQIFYKINSATSFDYPYSITLVNDNIFLIQKTGIDIYDKSLNKLKQIFEFAGEEKMSKENFEKIAIKYNKKYILSIINNKIFIFNNEGKLLYKDKEKINDNQIIYSYSLTFLHTTNDTCIYVIGYFDENSYLNLHLYRYDSEKKNIVLKSIQNKSHKYSIPNEILEPGIINFSYKQKLLSCEYMYSSMLSSGINSLVCFYNSDATIGTVVYYFDIDKYILFNYNYIEDIQINQYHGLFKNNLFVLTQNIDNNKNITSIKSELNNNRKQAIVWWNFKDDNKTRYFIYNLEYMIYLYKQSIYDINLYSSNMPNTCIKREYDSRINVFPDKDQISFSCAIEDENIQILLYNKTDLTNDSYIINISCKNSNGLSKFYFNNDENYLIYPCFKDCSDKKFENDTDCLNKKENEEENGNEEEKEKEKEENKKNCKMNTIMIILIIVIIITLLIVLIIILIKYFERKWKKGKEDEMSMKNKLSGLLPNNQ